jgi:hypothetical protein
MKRDLRYDSYIASIEGIWAELFGERLDRIIIDV